MTNHSESLPTLYLGFMRLKEDVIDVATNLVAMGLRINHRRRFHQLFLQVLENLYLSPPVDDAPACQMLPDQLRKKPAAIRA
ncbi:hypothetical protein BWP39_01635 [Paraburkholderia acidicola]|uniref:Uncharacterized protein n=1 Tax=Paraburkholderia acidicola TaxID=1912599 RepID=A0A2A4F8L0_9BURK|nr:hypothetical protein BWP39_01635 [Paraburkholderia acidicola]